MAESKHKLPFDSARSGLRSEPAPDLIRGATEFQTAPLLDRNFERFAGLRFEHLASQSVH